MRSMSPVCSFQDTPGDFRAEVVRSALIAYDSMIQNDAEGEEPLYRPKGWKQIERVKARRAGKVDWYKKRKGEDSNESVVFVPATPGGVMRKRYVEAIEKAGVKIGVAEVPGYIEIDCAPRLKLYDIGRKIRRIRKIFKKSD